MSNRTANDTDSDVSELDPKELSNTLNYDKYACQLGYAEDPETPLTADTFPSKSGGKPVSFHCSIVTIALFNLYIFVGLVKS
jgi:pre-rRNA-processing protein TSR4